MRFFIASLCYFLLVLDGYSAVIDDCLAKHPMELETTPWSGVTIELRGLIAPSGKAVANFTAAMETLFDLCTQEKKFPGTQKVTGLPDETINLLDRLSGPDYAQKKAKKKIVSSYWWEEDYDNKYYLKAYIQDGVVNIELLTWSEPAYKGTFIPVEARKAKISAEGRGESFASALNEALEKREEKIITPFFLEGRDITTDKNMLNELNFRVVDLKHINKTLNKIKEKEKENANKEISYVNKKLNDGPKTDDYPGEKWFLPTFQDRPKVLNELMTINEAPFAQGDFAKAYFAISKIDRPEVNLKAGQKIVIRISPRDNRKQSWHRESMNVMYNVLFRMAKIGKDLSPIFPKFYGTYFGPKPNFPEFRGPEMVALYQEMEYLPEEVSDFTDSALFEFCFGQWVAKERAGVDTTFDDHLRNFRSNNADYYRVYHVGSDTYIFPPSKIPMRIDFDSIRDINATGLKDSPRCTLPAHITYNLSDLGQKAYVELSKKEGNITDIFSKHFGKFKVSEDNPIPNENVKHYYY